MSDRVPNDQLTSHPFMTSVVESLASVAAARSSDAPVDHEWISTTPDEENPLGFAIFGNPYVRADAVVSYTYKNGKWGVLFAVVSASPYDLKIGAGSKLASERAAQSCGLAITHFENAERLLHDAVSDSLTGLLNRRGFSAVLSEQVADQLQPTAVVLLDLDGFKRINDRFGHAAGDEVLIEVGRRLTQLVGSDRLAARLGGDEFALLTKEANLQAVTGQLYETISKPMTIGGMKMSVGVSVGAASIANSTSDLEAVLREADERMYEQKGEATP